MLKRLKKCLDKIVQSIKKIFKKKTKDLETWTFYAGPMPVITSLSEDNNDEPLFKLNINPASMTFTMDNVEFNEELLLEKLSSTSLTNLPKYYSCKALILSVYGNQPWSGIGVDLSQYEEKGLAHFFVMRAESPEEVMEEYRRKHPDSTLEYNEGEDSISAILPDTILIEYGDGTWEYI